MPDCPKGQKLDHQKKLKTGSEWNAQTIKHLTIVRHALLSESLASEAKESDPIPPGQQHEWRFKARTDSEENEAEERGKLEN